MSMKTEHPEEHHVETPHFFVVEIDAEKGRYAICERRMVLASDCDDLTRELIRGYLDRRALRAAALPGWKGGRDGEPCDPEGGAPAMQMFSGQMGGSMAFSGQMGGKVVINYYEAGDPDKK